MRSHLRNGDMCLRVISNLYLTENILVASFSEINAEVLSFGYHFGDF